MKTVVISTSFKLSGKSPVIRHSLKRMGFRRSIRISIRMGFRISFRRSIKAYFNISGGVVFLDFKLTFEVHVLNVF